MKKVLQKVKENKSILHIFVLFAIALILSIPLMSKNNNIYFDDGCQHLLRAYWTYKDLVQNHSSMVISEFGSGFGYSWDLFYGPMSTWLVILFGFILGSFNIGFKMALFFIMFVSGILMYKLVTELTNNKLTALLAGIIYITSPYFFTDIYIRHSLGECMAFIFIPLVFLGLYNLFNTEKNHYYLIFGAVRINIIT